MIGTMYHDHDSPSMTSADYGAAGKGRPSQRVAEGQGMSRLQPNGKPMRALRALADTNAAEPLTEFGVFRACGGKWYHKALATLVDRGLAIRCGNYGCYEWYITQAGKDLLASDYS